MNTARGLYQRWCELLQEDAAVGREELDWTTNELRNGLRSIEWDLEDLEETIDILGGCKASWESPLLWQGAAAHLGGVEGLRQRRGLCLALALTIDSGLTHSGSQPRKVQAPSRRPAGEKGVRGADAGGSPGEEFSGGVSVGRLGCFFCLMVSLPPGYEGPHGQPSSHGLHGEE